MSDFGFTVRAALSALGIETINLAPVVANSSCTVALCVRRKRRDVRAAQSFLRSTEGPGAMS